MINFKTGTGNEPAVLEIEGVALTIFNELCAMVAGVCETIAEKTDTPYEIVIAALNYTLGEDAKNKKGGKPDGGRLSS